MKKLISLGLTLAMCGCLTLSACAVPAEDAPKVSDDPKNTVDTFVDSGEDSADTDIEAFANSAGSTEIKEAYGTITLSNPILYTISTSDLGKIDMSSMEAIVEGMPYDEDTFGCPATEYPSRYMWSEISAVYAVPEGTTVKLPSDIVTASVFELDFTWKNGACRADQMEVSLLPGYDSLGLVDTEFILVVELENTAITQNTASGGSAVGDNIAGKIAFYVPADTTAANPFGSSAPAAPVKPAAPSTPAATGSSAFTDVAANSPFKDAIAWAVEKGITNGTTPTTFGPGNTCSISNILTFLWRASGKPEAAEGVADRDSAATWAVKQEMIEKGTDVSAPCTRSAAVTFMWFAAGKPEAKTTANFTDVAAGANYAAAVAWAVENGITTGTSASTFSPENTCTRGQIVTFLYRALSKS